MDVSLYAHDDSFGISIDGKELMHSKASASECYLGEIGVSHLINSEKSRILIGGLGLGFTLKSVLSHSSSYVKVDVVEIIPEIIDWNKTFLHGLLVVEDKLSMAHGLESRVPFLDNDLVDFAMQCPVGLKLNNLSDVVRINENEPGNKSQKFFKKSRDGKQIMRDVMSRHIPREVTQAEKQGFSAPDSSWFKGESIDFVKSKLLNKSSRLYDYLDQSSVERLVYQHLDGKVNRRLLIWSLINFEQILNE